MPFRFTVWKMFRDFLSVKGAVLKKVDGLCLNWWVIISVKLVPVECCAEWLLCGLWFTFCNDVYIFSLAVHRLCKIIYLSCLCDLCAHHVHLPPVGNLRFMLLCWWVECVTTVLLMVNMSRFIRVSCEKLYRVVHLRVLDETLRIMLLFFIFKWNKICVSPRQCCYTGIHHLLFTFVPREAIAIGCCLSVCLQRWWIVITYIEIAESNFTK